MSTAGNLPNMLPVPDALQPVSYAPAQIQVDQEGPSLTPADFWRIIKQRKWLVAISFVVLSLLVLLGTFITWRYFPAYPAEALLELLPPRDVTKITEEMVNPENMRLLMETEAQKIAQPSIFQDVLALPEVKDTSFYQWYSSFEDCLDDMKRLVSVAPIPDSRLIRIRIALRSKAEAKLVAEKVVEQYLRRFTSGEQDSKRRTLDDFKAQRENITKERDQKRQEMVAFRNAANIPAIQGATVEITQISNIGAKISELRGYEAVLRSRLDLIRGASNPDMLPVTAEMRLILEGDPIIRFNRTQVETLDIQIETFLASGRVGENHRDIVTLKAQREQYYQKEIQRREEVLDDLRERQLDEVKSELAQVTSTISQFVDELAAAEAKQQDLDEAIVRYRQMDDDYVRMEKSLLDIEEKVREAQLAVDTSPRQPRLSQFQAPREAVWPSRPSLILFLGGGFVASLLGALGLAFLRELTDTAIRTPLDIRNSAQLSFLGAIPLIDYEEAEVEDIELATRQAPQSLVAEAFRSVRAQLMFSGPTESQRVLLLTSSGPGDGTTACAINLAVTFAQSNQRVLLIDCNFRRPAMRASFRNTKSEGLSNVLIGQRKLADVISHTELPNLDVVTTGPMPPSPGELLGSSYMADLIREAAQSYDRVILDGPPVLLVSDSLVLSTLADGVIIVARAVQNTKGEVRRAREQIQRCGGRVIGGILNGVQYRAGGYMKQQFREFYDYTSDEAVQREMLGGPAEGEKEGPAKPPADADDEK